MNLLKLEKTFFKELPKEYKQPLSITRTRDIVLNIFTLLGITFPISEIFYNNKKSKSLVEVFHEVAHLLTEIDYQYYGHGKHFVWCESQVFDAFKDIYTGGR